MAAKKQVEVTNIVPPTPALVRVTNMKMGRREVPLIDGTSLHLGAWHNRGTAHISKPIDEKLLSRAAFKMKSRGELSIEGV